MKEELESSSLSDEAYTTRIDPLHDSDLDFEVASLVYGLSEVYTEMRA